MADTNLFLFNPEELATIRKALKYIESGAEYGAEDANQRTPEARAQEPRSYSELYSYTVNLHGAKVTQLTSRIP